MTRKCQDITIRAACLGNRGEPVFYASLPVDSETNKGCGTNRAADQRHLAALLWDHLAAMKNPHWQNRHSLDRAVFPLQVVHGPLGRPHLLLGEVQGPAISFSESGSKVWAALCGDASDIGIDVAAADEFRGEYPLHRVFHDQELHHAVRLTGGDVAEASALLWSVKEAVVKALGCAFHLGAPRQVHVSPAAEGGGGGYSFPVCLSGKALAHYPMAAGRSLGVRSFPLGKMWLSIALLSSRSQCGKDGNFQINALPRQNVDS